MPGAVQPLTRKMAEVAMRVAMVMPEMGLAELPMRPTMRETDGDEEESEENDQHERRRYWPAGQPARRGRA